MNRRNTLGTALVVLAVVLFVVPAVFPAQPVLIHDTDRTTRDSMTHSTYSRPVR